MTNKYGHSIDTIARTLAQDHNWKKIKIEKLEHTIGEFYYISIKMKCSDCKRIATLVGYALVFEDEKKDWITGGKCEQE